MFSRNIRQLDGFNPAKAGMGFGCYHLNHNIQGGNPNIIGQERPYTVSIMNTSVDKLFYSPDFFEVECIAVNDGFLSGDRFCFAHKTGWFFR